MNIIKYGVIGVGYFGAELGRIINSIEDAKVVAIYDPENGKTVASEFGCDNEKSVEALCSRNDISCVIIASPNYCHYEAVMTAAKYKKNVFCEKPIALSYRDCDDMVNACKKAGVVFMAGHVMNFFNGVHHAKEIIASGKIGKVLYCHSARNGWAPEQESISWKKIREKSGGHLYHHIHELDCIQFIMGPATEVTMIGGNVAHSGPRFGNEDDMLILSLEFGNNTYAICEYGSAFHWSEHYLLIQGTKGAIKIDMKDCGMTVKDETGGETQYLLHETKEEDDDRKRTYRELDLTGAIVYGKPGTTPPLWLQVIMKKEMNYFNSLMKGAACSEEFKPLLTGEAARSSIATADAATLSLKENRKVKISEITKR